MTLLYLPVAWLVVEHNLHSMIQQNVRFTNYGCGRDNTTIQLFTFAITPIHLPDRVES